MGIVNDKDQKSVIRNGAKYISPNHSVFVINMFHTNIDLFQLFLLFLSGDCDHLEPYPLYSETRHKYINLTTWDKPRPPEIDFLNSYVNLSSYHPIALQGLAIGYKTMKHAKYFASSKWGCKLMFPIDPDLADACYHDHHTNSNHTLFICTPHIPARPDLRRKMIELTNNIYSMLGCDIYKLGYYKSLHELSQWSYIFSSKFPLESLIYAVMAYLTAVIGIFGKYCTLPFAQYFLLCANGCWLEQTVKSYILERTLENLNI